MLRRLCHALALLAALLFVGSASMAGEARLIAGEGVDTAYDAALGQALRAAITDELGSKIARKSVPGAVPAIAAELAPAESAISTATIRGSQASGAFGGDAADATFRPDSPIIAFASESGGVVTRYQVVAARREPAGWRVSIVAELAGK